MNFEIKELLKGTRPIKDQSGNVIVQTIKNMKLVCLTTDDEFNIDRFANPMDVVPSNRNYGHLNLKNNSSRPMIVPAQIAVMTKQAAQNHGMVKAGYIKANYAKDYNDAGCIQGGQTGMITNASQIEIRMIPFGAREMIFEKAGHTGDYQNIYAAIDRVGKQTGANSGTYLDVFFNKHDKELVEFIAHFERPEKCIGVMVFIDDELVAVDKFPSFTYCEQIWDVLIRDCYGSLVLVQKAKGKTSDKLFTSVLKKTDQKTNESPVNYLKRALAKTKKKITESVVDKIRDFVDLEFDGAKDDVDSSYSSYILKHQGYIGQVISEDKYHHLVSIVKKEAFDPSALRKISEMRQKAKNQTNFEI